MPRGGPTPRQPTSSSGSLVSRPVAQEADRDSSDSVSPSCRSSERRRQRTDDHLPRRRTRHQLLYRLLRLPLHLQPRWQLVYPERVLLEQQCQPAIRRKSRRRGLLLCRLGQRDLRSPHPAVHPGSEPPEPQPHLRAGHHGLSGARHHHEHHHGCGEDSLEVRPGLVQRVRAVLHHIPSIPADPIPTGSRSTRRPTAKSPSGPSL